MQIAFPCPHCGEPVSVSREYAGQIGPCPHCLAALTVPRPDGLPEATLPSSWKYGRRKRRIWPRQFTLASMLLWTTVIALLLGSCRFLASVEFFEGPQWVGASLSLLLVVALLALAARVRSAHVAGLLGALAGCAWIAYPLFLGLTGRADLGSPYLWLISCMSYPLVVLVYPMLVFFAPFILPRYGLAFPILPAALVVLYWAAIGMLIARLVHRVFSSRAAALEAITWEEAHPNTEEQVWLCDEE
jgi:hypothetical protein